MVATRILVVEDENVIREMMAEALSGAGFGVDQATDAEMAEALLEADGYGLLVTDIHMPGRYDGLDLAERTHAAKPDMPILVVTGRPDALGRLEGSNLQMSALIKPFRLAELVKAVRTLVGPETPDLRPA
jgi:two-component system cell cycle response regulator CpdR